MNRENEFELVVHQGKRPLWQIVLAAASYTLMFYALFQIFNLFYTFGYNDYTLQKLPSFVKLSVYLFCTGVLFSVMKSIFIDVDKNKLITRYSVGPFSYSTTSTVPSLEYVSVFKDNRQQYQVNLWYNTNKHYEMSVFEKDVEAFNFATQIAKKLNLALLDATKKGDSKWVSVS